MEAPAPRAVSVVMPVFNGQAHLETALDSILAQAAPSFELIAVDDGSTDQTASILDRRSRRDSRLRVIRQPHSGIVAALNRGVAAARGRYIARMDADDVSLPGRLGLQAGYLDSHPAIGLVASRVAYLGDSERNRGLSVFVDWTNALTTPDDIALSRFIESPFVHPSVMFRRELTARFGAYRDGDFPEDYELWLRWLERGVRMAKLDQTLLEWRESLGRLTRSDPRYSVEAFYRTKTPYLCRWLERHNPHHPEVIVWGSGRTSRQRQRFLITLGVRVRAYVDIDPRKIGYTIGDAKVIAPKRLPPPESCFVLGWVGSRGARDDIARELEQRRYVRGRHYILCA